VTAPPAENAVALIESVNSRIVGNPSLTGIKEGLPVARPESALAFKAKLSAPGLTKLANLDEDKGHIVSERTVSPLSDTVQDGLLHLGKVLLC
jgi:hypothetical protein